MALYDVLNDDDDEVRHVGSAAARSLLGRLLVPVEAANALLTWLSEMFKDSSTFRGIVAARMVGSHGTLDASVEWKSAEEQLNMALTFDDALFVIEESNLFVDEVREAKRWSRVFASLSWSSTDESLVKLNSWVAGGLNQLSQLTSKSDGPLGWASTPEVFAISYRLLLASPTIFYNGQASGELENARTGMQTAMSILEEQGKDVLSGFLHTR